MSPGSRSGSSRRNSLTRESLSVIGRRKNNEDSHGFFEPEDTARYAQKGSLVVVADGMGGHAGGEVASLMAVNIVRDTYAQDPDDDMTHSLARAVRAANEAIIKRATEDHRLLGMGTTCTALVVRGEEATYAHVGDSRAYLIRKKEIVQLTRDHSLLNERSGDTTYVGNKADAHILTRALGAEQSVTVDVPSTTIRVRNKDLFLVCSDGLCKVLPDEDLLRAATRHQPAEACDRLVQLALERGATDNITVEIVRVDAVAGTSPGWWSRLRNLFRRGKGGTPPRRSTSQIVVARSTPHTREKE